MGKTDEVLKHYGILGMKWGVRKKRNKNYAPPSKIRVSRDEYNKRVIQRKKLREMSNKDLQEITKRLNLEKTYKSLQRENMSKGKKVVSNFYNSVISNLTTMASKKVAEALMKKIEDTSKKK